MRRDCDSFLSSSFAEHFVQDDYASSQVIFIESPPPRSRLEIVVRFAMTEPFISYLRTGDREEEPISEFRSLSFLGVSEISFVGRVFRNQSAMIYKVDSGLEALSIENVVVGQPGVVALSFGFEKAIKLTAARLDVRVRQGLGRAKSSDPSKWEYVDKRTGELIEFTSPFS